MFIPRYPIHTDLNAEGELSEDATDLRQKGSWLRNALAMNVYNSKSAPLRKLVNFLFDEIMGKTATKAKSHNKFKQTLKAIIINLWFCALMGMPVRYPRDKNAYSHDSKYRQLYFKYANTINAIDALMALGYIEQKKGRSRYEDKKSGFQTRMWATPQLVSLFMEYGLLSPDCFEKPMPEELVIKKDEYKKYVGYREDKNTRRMRTDLERYNPFVKEHHITVVLPNDILINNEFLLKLFKGVITNTISINYIKPNKLNSIINIQTQQSLNTILKYINTNTSVTKHTITQMFQYEPTIDKRLHKISFDAKWRLIDLLTSLNRKLRGKRKKNDRRFLDLFPLKHIGIDELHLVLNQEYIYRVFSRNSFKYGGRAYGAQHQNLPSNMRPYIRINGDRTAEVDYSAFHIRMLYHKEGIAYQGDPYSVCAGPDLRDTFKSVGLIAINAKNEQKAMGAIGTELAKNGIPLPKVKQPLKWLVRAFKEAHEPIQKYLFSDVGVSLQNQDSHIMNTILMRLLDKDILGLSVHDSVIVAEQYQDVLRQIMVDAYEEVMNFKPRF